MQSIRRQLAQVVFPERPALTEADGGASAIVALSGISPWLWRLYGVFWLVCFWYALALVLQTHPTPSRLLVILGAGILCGGLYLWFIWSHPVEQRFRLPAQFRLALLGFLGLTALVLALSLLDNPAWLWLFVCVSAVAGLLFPQRQAFLVVSGLTLISLGVGILRLGWEQAIPLALLVRGLGVDVIGFLLLIRALQQVHQQRRSLAHLAVSEERERVARDLHDLLGRNLSAITLKSALAERLVLTDPTRALEEMQAVEGVARATLREVRAAIAGYQQLTLPGEVEGARQVLEAAAITPMFSLQVRTMPSDVEVVLAWVIREGVTNILRHSLATYAQVTLSQQEAQVWIEIVNDGCSASTSGRGQGLHGMAERVKVIGGQVQAGLQGHAPTATFHLRAEIPLVPTSGVAGEITV